MKSDLFKNPPPGLNSAGSVLLEKKTIDEQIAEELMTRQLKDGLPFKYGWPWYKWARAFYESQNKMNFLTAANQISKSSTQIRKCLNWATDQELWPELWLRRPTQFWYLYPTAKQVAAELETKWPLFLPSGSYRKDDEYGFKLIGTKRNPVGLEFRNGIYVYFKTYKQDVQALQTGTCDAIFCDEELPEDLYSELKFRTAATDGYFHMVFTATLGQEIWRKTMEPEDGEEENFPDAFKQTVSLYDSMYYEDGTASPWNLERIKRIEAQCPTQNEVLKRVHGKFIFTGGGLKYEAFDIKRHIKPGHQIPKHWLIFTAVDLGSGGQDKRSHFPSITFIAVSPDFRQGRAFKGWLGDDGLKYTAGDVYLKWKSMVAESKLHITRSFYDWGSSDFGEIATRNGTPFEKAEKSHTIGEDTINTLFKNDMMFIYDADPMPKLARELATVKKSTLKRNAKDNFADSFRYAVTKVPWDWTAITGAAVSDAEENIDKPMNDMQRQIAERRKSFDEDTNREQQRIDEEFSEWNEAYGGGEY